jgi:hypothetical protein
MSEAHSANGKQYQRRTSTAAAAFLIGLPVAVVLLAIVHRGPLHDTVAARYLRHEVECVELTLFCCAIAALGTKLWRSRSEKGAIRAAERGAVIPSWDGKPVPVEAAPQLLGGLAKLPRRLQRTYLVSRVADVLDFLCSRRSARELDDQLRTLTDNDALALEGSYALTRFITWAIPILGFLGTVLGITGAISGVTPEKLESELHTVTDGLALAFDATALGLALTMITMFVSFLVERVEQAMLESVDRFIDRQLAHRFEREGIDSGEFSDVVRQNTQALLKVTEHLVQRQAEIWSRSFEQIEKRLSEAEQRQQQRVQTALEVALNKTLEAHSKRVGDLDRQSAERNLQVLEKMAGLGNIIRDATREQQTALAPFARGLSAQAEAAARSQESEKQLLLLQEQLNRNLATLVGALQGMEFRVAASEFRLRLDTGEAKPELRLVKRPA